MKVEFLVTGEFPGDGKPKPFAFPDPAAVSEEFDGVRYVGLPTLIEMKLASGMSNVNRVKDIADVQELIKLLDFPASFAGRLQEFVRPKFVELWQALRRSGKRYVRLWPTKPPAGAAEELAAMLADGVVFDPQGGAAGDHTRLVTTDPAVARKYGMQDEADFWDESDRGDDKPE